jgi:DNA-binding transcriptional ArsR family regulator
MAERGNEYCEFRVIHQTKINKAKKRKLAADKVEQLAQLFKAIADPGRIKILQALKHDEMCVCDLAAFLEVSESAVSHQLRMLRHLQLVANRREGPVLYYRLNKEIAIQLLDLGLNYIEK